MEKTISAGIVVKHNDQYVIGRVTGTDYFDIFKGRVEHGETFHEAALRECYEESSLDFSDIKLKYLGLFEYTKRKNIALFVVDIPYVFVSELHCTILGPTGLPEFDHYELVDFDDMLTMVNKNMNSLLKSLETKIKSYYIKPEQEWMPSGHEDPNYATLGYLDSK